MCSGMLRLWIWLLQFFQDFHAIGNPLSGRLQRLRLKNCWLQQFTTNWRTEGLLGFSAFWLNHVELVRQTIGPANQLARNVSSWSFHESCKCHGFAKYLMRIGKNPAQVWRHLFSSTPCIWIRRKSGHARLFVFVICKMELHHVAHQVDIGVASLGILCMHSLFDRNLYLVSLRPTIFDSAYCYVQPTCLARSCAIIIPFFASPLLHVLSWFLNMTGIGIHRILTAGVCLTFQCLQWL